MRVDVRAFELMLIVIKNTKFGLGCSDVGCIWTNDKYIEQATPY
jgi:hypothetical protein